MLTVKQAAERTGVSEALVYGWINSGRLSHFRLGARGKRGAIRITETDLKIFLTSLKRGGQPAPPPILTAEPLKLKNLTLG